MESVISKSDRDVHIGSVIKSNLISVGLTSDQIDKITLEMTKDILDILENFEVVNRGRDNLFEEDEDYVD